MEKDISTGKLSDLKKLITKNRIYLIIGGILLIGIVIGVLLAINSGKPDVSGQLGQPQGSEGPSITYLPTTTRTVDQPPDSVLSLSQLRDPFADGIVLRGVIIGGAGSDLAVIETGNTAYVVSRGAVVAGDWTVAEINRSSVVLASGNSELILELGGRVTRGNTKAEEGEDGES